MLSFVGKPRAIPPPEGGIGDGSIEFGLLGEVTARLGAAEIDLGHRRGRSILAALLVDANRVVATDVLIDRIWAARPPVKARETLHSYVARLRRALRPVSDVRIVFRSGGYVIAVDPLCVDLHRFRHLVRLARDVPGTGEYGSLLSAALALWRGPALGQLDSPWAEDERATLELERLAAQLDYHDYVLGRGRGADLVATLSTLVTIHPFDERICAQLMRALQQSGRPTDALRLYDDLRRRLADHLGTVPGAAVADVQLSILRGEPPAPLRTAGSGPAAPHQLPAAPSPFIGRRAELARMDAMITQTGSPPGRPIVCIVSGTAGVGKTALALNWAHRMATRFSGGEIYLDLRGDEPQRPMTAGDALVVLLRSLGVSGAGIAPDTVERAAQWRTELQHRRLLILLDNAASSAQVRPLLPGTGSCVVIVISRDSLAGLVARDGAYRVELDLLPAAEAQELLLALIGDRVVSEPEHAATLADQCVRLPLALRIAAELAVARPGKSLGELVGDLGDRQQVLDLLDAGGDGSTAIRSVFSWSYDSLPPAQARLFRLLGLAPVGGLDVAAAAALASAAESLADEQIRQLMRAHLVATTSDGRYHMHDLLRAFAAEMSKRDDTDAEQTQALARLLDHYVAYASAAADTLFGAERHRRPPTPHHAVAEGRLAHRVAAQAWLDRERANLVALCTFAAMHGWPRHAVEFGAHLFRYLDVGGHHEDSLVVYAHGLSAARHLGDPAAEVDALTGLGRTHYRRGEHGKAADHLNQAREIARRRGEPRREAETLNNLGRVEAARGNARAALDHLRRAHDLFQEQDDWWGQCRALSNSADVYRSLGDYELAAQQYTQALGLVRTFGDPHAEAHALMNLGRVYVDQGRLDEAYQLETTALATLRECGDRRGVAQTLATLGDIHLRQQRHGRSSEHARAALAMSRQVGDPAIEAQALAVLRKLKVPAREIDAPRT